jgi:solute:Na+ symporter, SSS family
VIRTIMIDQIKQVNIFDYIVIASYLLMLTGVGIYVTRFNRNADDFFKGGGKVPWWISGLSTFVAGFSAFMFVGAAGYTYRKGLGSAVLFTSAFWGYLLGYAVYAVRWKRARLSSPMEFLTRRFSQSTTYYYTLLSIVPAILGLGLGIYILCIFVASALGIMNLTVNLGIVSLSGLEISMVVTGIVLLIYTSAGGLWAVMITDVLQFFIILIVTILIFPLSFLALGGSGGFLNAFTRLAAETPAGYLSLGDVLSQPLFYVAYLFSTFIGYNAAWHVGQRYYSVPTEKGARKMALLCAGLSLTMPLLWMAPSMAARLLFPDMAALWPRLSVPSEAAFVTLALTLLPNGMIGLTISAILAATMTHTDTALNYLASIITRDVYLKIKSTLGHPVPDEKRQLRMARITTFTLGLLAIVTAIIVQRTKGVFDFALLYYSWFGPSMMTPVMLGFLTTRTPSWSANVSATVSLVVVLLCNTVIDVQPYQYEVNIFGGILVAAAVFFLSMLWKDKEAGVRERIAAFGTDLATPALETERGWDRNALHSYKVVGVLTLGIGAALLILLLVPASIEVRTLTVLTALLTLAMGGGMLLYFRRQISATERRETGAV